MSCYLVPGTSTIINFETVYPRFVIGDPQTLTDLRSTVKEPQTTEGSSTNLLGIPTAAVCSDDLSTALAIVSPDTGSASSFVYRALGGAELPVAANCGPFCCAMSPPYVAVPTSGFPAAAALESFGQNGHRQQGKIASWDVSRFSAGLTSIRPGSESVPTSRRPTNQDFYRLRKLLRRVRRRAAAVNGERLSEDGKGDGEDDAVVQKYPLFCVVCRVKLNAQTQAKQHYTGRNHARRVRLLYGPSVAADPALSAPHQPTKKAICAGSDAMETKSGCEDAGTPADVDNDVRRSPSSQSSSVDIPQRDRATQAAPPAPRLPVGTASPISCDVYCSACAVSFNSTLQARQHYHGKSHAKRLRNSLSEGRTQPHCLGNISNSTTFHKDAIFTCLVCNARPQNVKDKQTHQTTTAKRHHSYRNNRQHHNRRQRFARHIR